MQERRILETELTRVKQMLEHKMKEVDDKTDQT